MSHSEIELNSPETSLNTINKPKKQQVKAENLYPSTYLKHQSKLYSRYISLYKQTHTHT